MILLKCLVRESTILKAKIYGKHDDDKHVFLSLPLHLPLSSSSAATRCQITYILARVRHSNVDWIGSLPPLSLLHLLPISLVLFLIIEGRRSILCVVCLRIM